MIVIELFLLPLVIIAILVAAVRPAHVSAA
jgi:hypothetical protein